MADVATQQIGYVHALILQTLYPTYTLSGSLLTTKVETMGFLWHDVSLQHIITPLLFISSRYSSSDT